MVVIAYIGALERRRSDAVGHVDGAGDYGAGQRWSFPTTFGRRCARRGEVPVMTVF